MQRYTFFLIGYLLICLFVHLMWICVIVCLFLSLLSICQFRLRLRSGNKADTERSRSMDLMKDLCCC